MKDCFRSFALVLCMMCIIAFASPMLITATSLDDLSNGSTTNQGNSSDSQPTDDNAISDYLKDYTPVTNENMEKAGQMASPITNAMGTIAGFIVMIASAGIFLITSIDLLYIAMPPLRSILNPRQNMGAQAGGMPRGGMGMGMDDMFGDAETLILNSSNKLVQYILENKDAENVDIFCKQLYDLAMIANKPLKPEAMTEFIARSNEIMMLLTK